MKLELAWTANLLERDCIKSQTRTSQMNQQQLQDLSKLTSLFSNEVEMYKKHKAEMIVIILKKEATSESKLDSLEESILRFRVEKPSEPSQTSESGLVDFTTLKNVGVDDLTKIAEIMESISKPAVGSPP